MVSGWRVEVYDDTLAQVGLCDVFTSLSIALRHRQGGGWTMTLPAQHDQAALFAEGSRICVWAPWSTTRPLMSGPVTGLETTLPDASSPATLSLTGVDDTALLADRIVLPDPTTAMDNQATDAYWTYSAAAEGVIRTVVDANAGDSATTGRRICDADPDNRLASPGSLIGTTRDARARFDNLLELVNDIASTDNLSVSLYQPAGVTDLHLDVQATTDRSDSVLLSLDVGTLSAGTATLSAPSATNVLVAGGGEGTARTFVERVDTDLSDAWSRRIETFVDARDTTDTTELAQRGDETLTEAAATAGLSLDPRDSSAQQFGIDYSLGDTVRVEIGGTTWTDIVTAINVTVSAADGATVKPSVGDADLADPSSPMIYRRVRDITARLDALERRL